MRIEVDGRDTVDLLHRQRDLEQAAHRRWLRTGEDRASTIALMSPKPVAPRGSATPSLAEIGDHMIGVVVGEHRTRLIDLGLAMTCATWGHRAHRAADRDRTGPV